MKSLTDFDTLNEYRDYLMDYYAGQALSGYNYSEDFGLYAAKARLMAVALVKEIYGDWT